SLLLLLLTGENLSLGMELMNLCLVVLPFLSDSFREHALLREILSLLCLFLLRVPLILPLLLLFLSLPLNL
ncbi:hypothetical protein ACMBCN_02985, partial [Candidatus Liberibacter asiaticus]|nr:hypothetical protein [Candidatus Liberibacter asiaticus]